MSIATINHGGFGYRCLVAVIPDLEKGCDLCLVIIMCSNDGGDGRREEVRPCRGDFDKREFDKYKLKLRHQSNICLNNVSRLWS
ncbi:hypothetical protein RIF29_24049 [Crotalaria pallida]|uniref:Uncharacterized protein n=1 Tax=Crotalaria pallida TaxID=3830 RepID=A0AAN9EL89_CROPI